MDTGEELAKELVSITSDVFDFHFTQYAADGSKFYIYDNRSQSTGTNSATFDTYPFEPIDIGTYTFNLKTGDGKNVNLEYTYSYKDIADDVVMTWQQNAAGEYVKLADGSYVKYDSTVHANVPDTDRFDLDIAYQVENNGTTSTVTRDEMIEDYSEKAIDKMLTSTKVDFNATDFTTIAVDGDENDNVAIRSLFEMAVEGPEYEKGINIQCSSNVGDSVKIPRFPLHTVSLRLYRVDATSHKSASESLSIISRALDTVSGMRSTYGAYNNRLEHTYASRANMEENTQAAESRIRDTDMADEMVEYSKHSILGQAGQSVLAQANQSMQNVLMLLR